MFPENMESDRQHLCQITEIDRKMCLCQTLHSYALIFIPKGFAVLWKGQRSRHVNKKITVKLTSAVTDVIQSEIEA